MAKGDIYDASRYSWQLRENTSGGVFIRYDDVISSDNKGRYNTSSLVSVETAGFNQASPTYSILTKLVYNENGFSDSVSIKQVQLTQF